MSRIFGQQPVNQPRHEKGWECPKCGRVYAPWVPKCDVCGRLEDER